MLGASELPERGGNDSIDRIAILMGFAPNQHLATLGRDGAARCLDRPRAMVACVRFTCSA